MKDKNVNTMKILAITIDGAREPEPIAGKGYRFKR
jgi:hypothetical protein